MPKALEALQKCVASFCRSRGWSQAELARRAGMAPAQLSTYVTGKNSPSLEVLERIADAFGISAGELLGGPADHPIEECHRRIGEAITRAGALARIRATLPVQDVPSLDAIERALAAAAKDSPKKSGG